MTRYLVLDVLIFKTSFQENTLNGEQVNKTIKFSTRELVIRIIGNKLNNLTWMPYWLEILHFKLVKLVTLLELKLYGFKLSTLL